MKPWREVAVPHPDVLEGTFQQSEFAADITAVRTGHATRVTLRPNRLGRTLLWRLGVLRVRLTIEVTDRMNRLTTATELVGLVDEEAR